MFYIIQENLFKEVHYENLIDAVQRLGLDYETIDCRPFTEVTEHLTDRQDVFVFGSVKLARLATKNNWQPGSFYGGNHAFDIYSNYYGENLLNHDSIILKYGDILEWEPNEVKFIRPCRDSKIFTGKLFTKTKWEDMRLQGEINISDDVLIQVASPKAIYREVRTWIVGGKVVSSSYYFFYGDSPSLADVESEAIEFAQSMANLYQVAPAFVMDVCLTPDGWKIVEINCINCSGFYKGDIQKLLIALEDYFI